MPEGKAAQRLKLDRFAICVYHRARRSRSTLPSLGRRVSRLILDLKLTNHSKIRMRDFLVRGLRICDEWRLTMKNVVTGSEASAHPDNSPNVVIVEDATHCIDRSRTATMIFPPSMDVS